jgi:hypothetical protein
MPARNGPFERRPDRVACTVDDHNALAGLPRVQWLRRTVPLANGRRPISSGAEYGDCAACLAATGKRYTFSRPVDR